MKKIDLYNGRTVVAQALVDDADWKWLTTGGRWFYRSRIVKRGLREWAYRHEREGDVQITVYMHRKILGLKKGDGFEGDHRDWDGLNNQRFNLRKFTKRQNREHCRKVIGGTSKFRGVSWHPRAKKWRATIARIYLGLFVDEFEAAKAVDQKLMELWGADATTNASLGLMR